jgi:hypothetical protein
MHQTANEAFCDLTARQEARMREEVRRRLALTRARARQRHEQTLLRLARLLHPTKPT